MIDYRFYVSNIYSWLTMSLIVDSSTHRWGKCYQGGCSSKARETFRAHSPSVSKNGKVFTLENSCMKGTSGHIKNMWMKQLGCNHKVRDFAMALRARNVSGAFDKRVAGAIIGDGDLKCTPFPVLGLSLWYGTIFLSLEQTACWTRTNILLRGFCVCRSGEMAYEIPKIFYAFGPQLNMFMSVGILLKYFRRKLLKFE